MAGAAHLAVALAAAAAMIAPSPAAHALGFAEAYAAARGHDAQFRAANHELDASRQLVPITRAALLPVVGVNLSRFDYSGTKSFTNSLNQEVKTDVAYGSPKASLTARMPLLNYEASKRHEQAHVQVEIAESTHRARSLELIDRLGTAYLQVLLAADNVTLAQSQLQAAQAQAARAEQRLRRGEGTRTDVAATQAGVDIGRVRVLEAQDQYEVARRAFKRVTGLDPVPLNRLAADFMPGEMVPATLGEWLGLAVNSNPQIQARQQALRAARLGVDRQTAGHYPRVDLVASMERNTNESITSLNQTNVLSSLGVQVSVPIYSGGGIDASVKQALADQARAEEEIKNEREAVELDVQRLHQAVAQGATKIAAYQRAVASSEVAAQGASRALDNGLGTTADVMDAQSRLDLARRDLAQARYDYLLARLRLMATAGLPMEEVVSDIDRLLPNTAPTQP